jgi:hypothetical protein
MKEFNKKVPFWARKSINKEQLHDITKNLTNEIITWTHEKCKRGCYWV